MILDRLEHADIYESVHPGFAKMVEWMRTVASPDMPVNVNEKVSQALMNF